MRAERLEQVDPMLKQFLKDLVSEMVQEFNDEIVSMALFGSGATKEWIKGKSDIDFIVVIKDEKLKKKVEDSIDQILIKVDKKHNLKLTQTCCTFIKHKNPLVNFLYRLEYILTFGKPFFVFSVKELEFEKGTIANAQVRFITSIFDPLVIFLAKMKQTGVTIYGQNLIEKINYTVTPLEKVRIAIAPLWIVFMSIISFPLDHQFALSHAIKSTLWACEDSLFAMDQSLSSTKDEIQLILDIFGENINIEHLNLTLELKKKTIEKTTSKGFVAKYILNTIGFILKLYFKTGDANKKK